MREHLARQGKLLCRVVPDMFFKRDVGLAIDSRVGVNLATNAFSMATNPRKLKAEAVIREGGTTAHFSPLGHSSKALIESFRERMQVEALNRQRWNMRTELAKAMFKNIESF